MEKTVEPVIENHMESHLLGIIIAVLTVILTLVLFSLWKRRKSSGHSVLLTGLCDSGKTLIYSRLIQSKFVNTHTSIKENVGDIFIKNKSYKIVDIPGHERVRYKYFDQYKNSIKALIFVIDSLTIQKDTRDVAEFLYNILSDAAVNRNSPVLILCNKQDQILSKGSKTIKQILEKEMNLLRVTKTSQLEATDASSTNSFLGKEGKTFEFSHLECNVEFAECSAFVKNKDAEADLKELNVWLQKI